MTRLVWKREGLLDTVKCKTPFGEYRAYRTGYDCSIMEFNGKEICRFQGSHSLSKAYAERHYERVVDAMKNEMVEIPINSKTSISISKYEAQRVRDVLQEMIDSNFKND